MKYLNSFLIVVFMLMCQGVWAQSNIGIPIIKNYTKKDYKAGLQNWDIEQDTSGRMYFANNNGLLIFDGANWKLHYVDNKTIIRSVEVDGNRIYVGSQGDLGYFEPNEKGALVYRSLLDKVAETHSDFSDVWKISRKNQQVLFRTGDRVLAYNIKEDNINVHYLDENFSILDKDNQRFYLHLLESNLPNFSDKVFQNLSKESILKNKIITSVIPIDNQFLLITIKNGIFRYNGEVFEPWLMNDQQMIRGHQINCAIRIDKERIAIGTLTGGLFIVNNDKQVLYHLNIKNGLQSNDVKTIFRDGAGNLWIGLANGISYIETSSPFSLIKPKKSFGAIGYDIQIHDNQIYLGTSNGLYVNEWKDYYHPLENQSFSLVQNTKGQVWDLDVLNEELLMGHHEGTFRVNGNQANSISNLQGTWIFKKLMNDENSMIVGNYSGINLYKFENGNWKFEHRIENIGESSRFVEQDKSGAIWITHPYKGIYKLTLDEENKKAITTKLYNKESGWPSKWNHVFKVKNKILFTSRNGIYSYNAALDSFERSKDWSDIVTTNSYALRLIEDNSGNIWFVTGDEVGRLNIKNVVVEKQFTKQVYPELRKKLLAGFEKIYPYDDENVFIPLENGFMHFNPAKEIVKDKLFHVHIQDVKLGDTTTVFGGWETDKLERIRFKHTENAFVFRYAASEFRNINFIKFQYLLEGLDNDWSAWSDKNIKEYTELAPGKYTFQVRAKNAYGQITEPKSFEFEILAPWYASFMAKMLYVIIGLGVLLGLASFQHKRHELEKIQLKEEQESNLQETTEEYQKIVAQNEAEISELQEEKLKAEIQFKNQELANTTMHLVQKRELMNRLKTSLEKIRKEVENPKIRKEIRATIQLLQQDVRLDSDWEQFTKYFDQVHVNFLKRLKETYPQLTPKDQKLCTYLRLNLSTKEIVPLMNISVRGVEVSRYRLRKKLELDTDVNLNEFMMNF